MSRTFVFIFVVIVLFVLSVLLDGCSSSVVNVRTATRLGIGECGCNLRCVKMHNIRYDVYSVDKEMYVKRCKNADE